MSSRTAVAGTLAAVLACGSTLAAEGAGAMKKLEAKDWSVPGIEMEMKLIPAGSFAMGSPESEMCRRDDEVRIRLVAAEVGGRDDEVEEAANAESFVHRLEVV